MKSLELRRHAPRDPDRDALSPAGRVRAEDVGRESLEGPYDALFVSPAKRAAETGAWFLRGMGQRIPTIHGVAEGLAGPADDVDGLAGTLRQLFADVPDGSRGLVVGHTPLIERAVERLTGRAVEPLAECEGVLVVDEGDGTYRVEREFRLDA